MVTRAGPQSGGAVQVFVGGIGSVPVFLGWGNTAPQPMFDPHYSTLKNDSRAAAPEGPAFDKMYVGQDAQVQGATFTVWDETVLLAMMKFGNSVPGVDFAANQGLLMVMEGFTYPLYFRNPRALTSQYMKQGGMPAGWRYLAAITGQVKRIPGTQPNMIMVTWQCLGFPINISAAGIDWKIWDNDMTGLRNSIVTLNPPTATG